MGSLQCASGRRAVWAVQSGMVVTAAVAALSMIAFGTSNLQLPTPKRQQASWELGVGSWEFAFAAQADQAGEADPAVLPISIERIREALQRPDLWIPPLPAPAVTFRSGVEDTLPFESVLDGMRRELALWSGANSIIYPPGGLPPSRLGVGVDVLPLISTAIKQWKTARARDRVGKELAAFCAVNDCSVLEGQRDGSPADRTPSPR